MRIIGLEEHFVTDEVLSAWGALGSRWQDLALEPSSEGTSGRRLIELGPERVAAMDDAGVDIQVLSLSTPGVQDLAPGDAVVLAAATNDRLSDVVRARPDRFHGLAALPMSRPDVAAAELVRAVSVLGLDGAMVHPRSRGRPLDDPGFWPVFEAAEALQAPLSLHPMSPPPAVRTAYYTGAGAASDAAFATHGLGWHVDAGVEVVRLMLAGVFDRFPDLQVVVGHWGELVLFYLERVEHLAVAAGLQRPLREYAKHNLLITPSGVLSHRYLRWAADVVGADRIMFATDYPFEVSSAGGAGRRFLEEAELDDADREGVASVNWERLRTRIRR